LLVRLALPACSSARRSLPGLSLGSLYLRFRWALYLPTLSLGSLYLRFRWAKARPRREKHQSLRTASIVFEQSERRLCIVPILRDPLQRKAS
jgi:hypothetical protein